MKVEDEKEIGDARYEQAKFSQSIRNIVSYSSSCLITKIPCHSKGDHQQIPIETTCKCHEKPNQPSYHLSLKEARKH